MVRSPVTDVLERANEVQKSMKMKGRKKKVKDDEEILVSKYSECMHSCTYAAC